MSDLDFAEITCDCCACSDLSSNTPPFPELKNILLRSALTYVKAEDNYDGWLWIGSIIHNETGGSEDGLDLFNAWSRKHSDYRGPDQVYLTWLSFDHDSPSPADLFTLRDELETLGVDWQEVASQAEDSFFWIEVAVEDFV